MPSEEQRHLELNGRPLDFRLRRSSRRSIGLRIDGQGLLLSVPLGARESDIQAALAARGEWIFHHLQRFAEQQLAQTAAALSDGGQVLYLGQPHVLRLTQGRAAVDYVPGELTVSLPAGAASGLLPKTLERWYRQQAIHHFSSRIHVYAQRLGVLAPMLQLTSARTRWGSCNHRGEIRLHWRLMQAEPALIDYVIAHELAHIIELNHSPRFWAQVERACPDWRRARSRLKSEGQRFWAW